jgi:serine/threonine protein kinase
LGVEYLHGHGVVHGDLKGVSAFIRTESFVYLLLLYANVMVDDAGHAKLIDFGLSRLLETVTDTPIFTLSIVSFFLRWCAPELILVENAHATQATDVYACASTVLQVFHALSAYSVHSDRLCICQLLTGDVPYGSHRDITIISGILTRSPLPKAVSPFSINQVNLLWNILEKCWAEAPHRPSIHQIKDRLRLFCP